MAAVLGGIANSFLDTATYPAVAEIMYKYTGIATMGIKLFISISQLMMPFFLGLAAGTNMSYLTLAIVAGAVIAVLGILAIFAPFPASSQSGKSESFLDNLKNAHFSLESVALILIGFTSTATFQLWLNCAQTFGKEIAGIPSETVSVMQTYYSAGTLAALFVTSVLITKFKQVRFPKIKGTITSLVMIASSLCNYTILSAASRMTAGNVIVMNIVITVIGVLLAVFVNMRYGTLLKNTEASR